MSISSDSSIERGIKINEIAIFFNSVYRSIYIFSGIIGMIAISPIVLFLIMPLSYLALVRNISRFNKLCINTSIVVNAENYKESYFLLEKLQQTNNSLRYFLKSVSHRRKNVIIKMMSPFIGQLKKMYVASKKFEHKFSKEICYSFSDLGYSYSEFLSKREELLKISKRYSKEEDDWKDFEISYNKYAINQ